MPFDPKNSEHKAKLYAAITAAAELNGEYFDDFLQTPFEKPWSLSPTSRRNLQRGEYSSVRAQALYNWMMDHHFAVAHEKAADIFPHTPEIRWRQIVDDNAIKGRLKLVIVPDDFGIVQRRSASTEADEEVKLGQLFYFELEMELPGYVVLFQVHRNKWHPIPLKGEKVFPLAIDPTNKCFPQSVEGQIEPIEENYDTGEHEFVAVIHEDRDPPLNIRGLVQAWGDKQITFHCLSVSIVG